MKIHKVLSIVTMVILCTSAFGKDVHGYFTKRYAEIAGLIKARNVSGLSAYFNKNLPSDFLYIGTGKETNNKEQFISHLKTGVGMLGNITSAYAKVGKVMVKGSVATFNVTVHMDASMSAGGKAHTMTVTDVQATTARKIHGVWKVSKIVEKNTKMLMDGKPMMPTKPRGGMPARMQPL